jgi:hypothetical protein
MGKNWIDTYPCRIQEENEKYFFSIDKGRGKEGKYVGKSD